jgi:hypothetical protein
MAFNPIAVRDQVTEDYRDYIQTEFRARPPTLQQRLVEALKRSVPWTPYLSSLSPRGSGGVPGA